MSEDFVNKIEPLLDSVDSETRAILVNIICFKMTSNYKLQIDKWLDNFDFDSPVDQLLAGIFGKFIVDFIEELSILEKNFSDMTKNKIFSEIKIIAVKILNNVIDSMDEAEEKHKNRYS
jgi:hypothetical protein